jgi:hypothetical protein
MTSSGTHSTISLLVPVAALALAAPAFAVSDGNYEPARQHCTGNANNADSPAATELHCHSFTLTVRDGVGHEYFGIGTQQVADGNATPFNDVDVWYDSDDGTGCHIYTFHSQSPQTPTGPKPCNFVDGRNPRGDPQSGLRLYLGADDNLDLGEHDSSESVSNGPSDGGAIVIALDPASVATWLAMVQAGNQKFLLTHPLPLLSAGGGACADGICVSIVTQQRERAYPGGRKTNRGVANYAGHLWDPESCSGPSDDPAKDCGGRTIRQWNRRNGNPTIDPGLQIYEDPDAQASPEGPYPLPALYVGTCGVVIGGGPIVFPASPLTNGAGQLLLDTGCHS